MSKLDFQVEKMDDVFEEVLPLLVKHWEEVAMYKDKIKLKIDYNRYKQLDNQGVLRIVTARDKGVLVGYFICFISNHLHYSSTVYALNDILFLSPAYRKSRNALNMFKFAEQDLKELGVDVIVVHMKVQMPFKSLVEYLGYDKAEWNYSKYIGD